jgi:hypothetical protein
LGVAPFFSLAFLAFFIINGPASFRTQAATPFHIFERRSFLDQNILDSMITAP